MFFEWSGFGRSLSAIVRSSMPPPCPASYAEPAEGSRRQGCVRGWPDMPDGGNDDFGQMVGAPTLIFSARRCRTHIAGGSREMDGGWASHLAPTAVGGRARRTASSP